MNGIRHRRATKPLVAMAAAIVLASIAPGVATADPGSSASPSSPTPVPPAGAPSPAALPALPANSTYARQILQALDPEHGEPARADVVRVGIALDKGTPQTVVAAELLRPSALDPHLRATFQQYLDRGADPAGLAFWRKQVQGGRSLESMGYALGTSAEAIRHAGAGTANYVKYGFSHVNGRPADPTGLSFWTYRLEHGHTKTEFLSNLVHTPTRMRKLAADAYVRYLGRAGDAGGVEHLALLYSQRKIGELDVIARLLGSAEARKSGCDPFDTRSCMMPFPNDLFTVPDPTTATGRRIAFKPEWTPANVQGKHADPTEWNRNDGYSVGQAAVLRVPGIDLTQTGATPLTDVGASLDADAPIVVIDADTGEHHPVFTELDSEVTGAATAKDQVLYIRPAVDYTAGHRYIVALRNLKRADGSAIEAPASFRAYRDDEPGVALGSVEARRPHMDELFGELGEAGVGKDDLYLAWDFTVASTENTTGRLLSIRDRALASLDGHAPAFTITSTTANPTTGVAKRVEGTFDVPLYLTGNGSPGNSFKNGADGLPVRNGTYQAPFDCEIPTAASTTPARPVVYGHGLFGDFGEVRSGPQRAMTADHDMLYCATNWIGMSEEDVPNAVNIVHDVSTFKTLADRSQQGILDTIFLGRLLHSADGFAANAAFQGTGGTPLFDTTHLFYDGNSQGAVIGGAYLAVSPDTEAGVLGVAGMNYSTLLERSVDFDPFRSVMATTYTDPVDRAVGLGFLQMLWDRGETNGYAAHVASDPLPGTPAKRVLIHVAVGDHQVAPLTAEVEARTMGIGVHRPAFADGRSPDVAPAWGIDTLETPSAGSGMVFWDSGSPLPPLGNLPPRAGADPHGDPRSSVDAQAQKSTFLAAGGQLIDVCSGAPCTAPHS